jgi:hypothetical protein
MNKDGNLARAITQKHPAEKTAPPAPSRSVGTVVSEFIRDLDSLAETAPLAMSAIAAGSRGAQEQLKAFIAERELKVDEGTHQVQIPSTEVLGFQRVVRKVSRTAAAITLVPRSMLVAFVSQFDGFLSRLLETIYLARPELLNGSERSLSFSELTAFESVEAARDHVLEKEIESLLRESHSKQFDWLEKKFDLPLRKDLPVWPTFIEVTERRNLFVHTAGQVSAQYLQVCQAHKADCTQIQRGQRLKAGRAYMTQAYEAIFEVGVKLGHVLWRKVLPEQREDADRHLNRVLFELLVDGKYNLAKTAADFATGLKKFSSAETRMIFVINRAQAYKWSGNEQRVQEILDAEDFTALQDKFQLAAAVLLNDFSRALRLVESMGDSRRNAASEYREWPLYRELRKRSDFAELFRKLFGQPLDFVATVASNPAAEIADDQVDREVESRSNEAGTSPNEAESVTPQRGG